MAWWFKSWGIAFPCSLMCCEVKLKLAVQAGCRRVAEGSCRKGSWRQKAKVFWKREQADTGEKKKKTALRSLLLLSVEQRQGCRKSAQAHLGNFCSCSCQQVQRSLKDGAQSVSTRWTSGRRKPPVLQEKYLKYLPYCCLEWACYCFTIFSFHLKL